MKSLCYIMMSLYCTNIIMLHFDAIVFLWSCYIILTHLYYDVMSFHYARNNKEPNYLYLYISLLRMTTEDNRSKPVLPVKNLLCICPQ